MKKIHPKRGSGPPSSVAKTNQVPLEPVDKEFENFILVHVCFAKAVRRTAFNSDPKAALERGSDSEVACFVIVSCMEITR